MARKFAELRAKMPPAARAKAASRSADLYVAMAFADAGIATYFDTDLHERIDPFIPIGD
jgi:hypothetical protein